MVKLSGHEQVIQYLANLEHPLKQEIEEVRQIILSANEHITEKIKWNSPSFCYHAEDRVTLNLHGKGFFRLVFHCGAKVIVREQKGRLFEDTTGLLEWASDDRAYLRIIDMNDLLEKKEKIIFLVKKWLEVTSIK